MANNIFQAKLATDTELVGRAQDRDRDALGELFVRHCGHVRRLLLSVTGVHDELDDLVQDVFVQVDRSIGKFRGDSMFTTWLHQLTVYVAYNFLRKPRRRLVPTDPNRLSEYVGGTSVGPQRNWESSESARRLEELLDTIKPLKRVAFILYAVEGCSVAEVAETTGVPVATAKSRIWFARRELRKKARRDPYLSSFLDGEVENETE